MENWKRKKNGEEEKRKTCRLRVSINFLTVCDFDHKYMWYAVRKNVKSFMWLYIYCGMTPEGRNNRTRGDVLC